MKWKANFSPYEEFVMRNRNHTIPVAAVGLIVVCSIPAQAKDGSGSAVDHSCPLPSNIRSRVEHCNQVGDFGGPEREMKYVPLSKPRQGGQVGGAKANPMIPKTPWGSEISEPGSDAYKRLKKKNDRVPAVPQKDQMLEIKSDSEPVKKEKESDKEPPKEK